MDKIKERMQKMTNGEIVDVLKGLINNHSDAEDLVFDIGLDILHDKTTEDQYVKIMDNLQSIMR